MRVGLRRRLKNTLPVDRILVQNDRMLVGKLCEVMS